MTESTDFYFLEEALNEGHREVQKRVRDFANREVLPIINDYWDRAEFPFELVPKIAKLGIVGTTIKGYGCPGMDRLTSALGPSDYLAGVLRGLRV